MKKIGMVLEGGAMRGMYTAGVLDVMMRNKIKIDGIIGVSAGALFGANYFSNQIGRVIRYNKKYCSDKRYISIRSLILTGNLVNKNFAYYKITKYLDPFDNEAYMRNGKDYYVVATNVETGKPQYFKIENVIEQLEELRATSAIPFASKIIKINGNKYLDGGISDSIPITKCKNLGFKKIIVILTQPIEYRKKELSSKKKKIIKLKFKKYPKLIDTMLNRHKNYNSTLEKIIDFENKNEIFVIRPSKKININIIERNPDKLQTIYDMGVNDCKKVIKDLKYFISK